MKKVTVKFWENGKAYTTTVSTRSAKKMLSTVRVLSVVGDEKLDKCADKVALFATQCGINPDDATAYAEFVECLYSR